MALAGETVSTSDSLRGAQLIISLQWSGMGFETGSVLESDGAEDNAEDGDLRGNGTGQEECLLINCT